MLHRVIYLSNSSRGFSADQIAQILEVSRRNNAAEDITGLLVCHDDCFFQTLEGPHDAVRARFARISRDTRHAGVLVLNDAPAAQRAFPHWRMGFATPDILGDTAREALLSLHEMAAGGLAGIGDRKVRVLLRSFLAGFRDLALHHHVPGADLRPAR